MDKIPYSTLDRTLDIQYLGEGPWRSYHVHTYGDDPYSLITSATISEMDKDGKELRSYDISQASLPVSLAVIFEINHFVEGKLDLATKEKQHVS